MKKDMFIDGLILASMIIVTVALLTFCLFPFAILLLRIETI